jgi:hypothetical protein
MSDYTNNSSYTSICTSNIYSCYISSQKLQIWIKFGIAGPYIGKTYFRLVWLLCNPQFTGSSKRNMYYKKDDHTYKSEKLPYTKHKHVVTHPSLERVSNQRSWKHTRLRQQGHWDRHIVYALAINVHKSRRITKANQDECVWKLNDITMCRIRKKYLNFFLVVATKISYKLHKNKTMFSKYMLM